MLLKINIECPILRQCLSDIKLQQKEYEKQAIDLYNFDFSVGLPKSGRFKWDSIKNDKVTDNKEFLESWDDKIQHYREKKADNIEDTFISEYPLDSKLK